MNKEQDPIEEIVKAIVDNSNTVDGALVMLDDIINGLTIEQKKNNPECKFDRDRYTLQLSALLQLRKNFPKNKDIEQRYEKTMKEIAKHIKEDLPDEQKLPFYRQMVKNDLDNMTLSDLFKYMKIMQCIKEESEKNETNVELLYKFLEEELKQFEFPV